MVINNIGITGVLALLGLSSLPLAAEQSIPAVAIGNPNWAILMTPEGYSDVALDNRPGFQGREYLSGEWAASIFYTGGSNPSGPIWLRKVWAFPCWDTNSNFTVDQVIAGDTPPFNSDGFQRFYSRISNGDLEITMRYEMIDTTTGIDQGDEKEGTGGAGSSTTSDRYVFVQKYEVKNLSGGGLSNVRFYHFLHGLKTGLSLYDDRVYGGPMSAYRYDNTQKGTSLSLHKVTSEIYLHADTVCMHAMDLPSAFECGYYGKKPADDHRVGKPSIGTHLSVEADSLNGVDFFEPSQTPQSWVSGAMCFNFPNLAAGATHEITVLLTIRTESVVVAPPPEIKIIDTFIDGSDFVLDFEETTGAPLDGFLLRSSKDMMGDFPADWPQLLVPRTIGLPYPGASRYRIPINLLVNPKCFYRIQPFIE